MMPARRLLESFVSLRSASLGGWLSRGGIFAGGLLVLALVALPGVARALEPYASLVPNPATAVNSEGRVRACVNCHNNPDGGAGCGMTPCLNPFGVAFRANAYVWNATLAMMDSDGDGFTNGQELQDPFGLWREGPLPGVASLATPPGNPAISPGDRDTDGDGYCAFGIDLNDDGDCRDAGENEGSFDCNETAVAIHSHATELCSNVVDDDCDGANTLADTECVDVVDRDGDGRCPRGTDMNGDRNCAGSGEMSASIVDCDDSRANVYTGGGENCSDTVDNDCDGDTDLADGQCQGDSDVDGDGYCPVGIDLNSDGDCVDAGEVVTSIGDCDDNNPAVNPDASEITALLCGDGVDNECDGAADLNDSECRSFRDEDLDGYCPLGQDVDRDGDCTGPPDLMTGADCDDGSALRNPGLLENCVDPDDIDEDCDGVSNLDDIGADGRVESTCEGYLDLDDDGYCYVGPDSNLDGDCVDVGEFGFGDCDEVSPLASMINPTSTEICTDGADNDCDGSADARDPECAAYVDADRDGFCEIGHDVNGDRDCADADEQDGPVDMAPTDPTVYPGAPENCLDERDNDQDGAIDADDTGCVSSVDADGDGYCPLGRDLNEDGDCLDDGEDVVISDCDDGDGEVRPGATEACFDYRDNDCDTDVDLFDRGCFYLLDRDGDGFCGMGVDDNGDGDCIDESEDRFGVDCDDTREDVNPNRPEMCTDGFDNDCDGAADMLDSQCACTTNVDCDDGDACTVDTCRGPLLGCGHTRALMCIDGGGLIDGGVGDVGGTTSGGCAVSRDARRGFGSSFVLAFLLLALMRRRSRTGPLQPATRRQEP
jgi:hypothetical protein